MKTPADKYNYILPKELIAQKPMYSRGKSRLLILHRKPFSLEHKHYFNLIDNINSGDIVVLNNTKVIPARLFAQPTEIPPSIKTPPKTIEILLLKPKNNPTDMTELTWEVLLGNYNSIYHTLQITDTNISCEVLSNTTHGTYYVKFGSNPDKIISWAGHVPLPKYIKRSDTTLDKTRYQTVFAHNAGSVAAPTASINLTKSMLARLRMKGVKIAYLTLYVGWGTFAPIKTKYLEDFQIHTEYAELPKETTDVINAKPPGSRVFAFGTTVTRTLEGVFRKFGKLQEFSGNIDIFIYPPYSFKVVNCLVTNFHAPNSSVLLLASAFAEPENLRKAYHTAIDQKYRFLSYGDSMLII